MNDKSKAYKMAEQITAEIVDICIKKELSMLEFQLLRTTLPIAINEVIERCMQETKIYQSISACSSCSDLRN